MSGLLLLGRFILCLRKLVRSNDLTGASTLRVTLSLFDTRTRVPCAVLQRLLLSHLSLTGLLRPHSSFRLAPALDQSFVTVWNSNMGQKDKWKAKKICNITSQSVVCHVTQHPIKLFVKFSKNVGMLCYITNNLLGHFLGHCVIGTFRYWELLILGPFVIGTFCYWDL